MRTYRCADCAQPLALAVEPPAGLPFAVTTALVQAEQAARRHHRLCPGRPQDALAERRTDLIA